MKKYLSIFAMALLMACVCPVLTSCSSDDDDNEEVVTLDKTAYDAQLAVCKALLASATSEDYPQSAIDTFKETVATIEVAAAACKTQAQLDALVNQLTVAAETFQAAAYGAIPAANIIAKWDFNNEASDQVSTGTYKWTAVCTAAPACFNTRAMPTFVQGVEGTAVSLENGAHLVINDYLENAVTPKDFSISVWVKVSKTYPNNYIMSNNFWNTWKIQVQDQNKPFFTFATNEGIADADNEMDQSVKEGEWTQIVVVLSLTNHTLSFYVNGELTKTWDAEGKPALKGNSWADPYVPASCNRLPLLIGLSTTEAEATAAWTWDWNAESLGAFYGAIDNLTLYNTALTAGQVKKLYKDKN